AGAPSTAQAADPDPLAGAAIGKTATGQGVFDCLNSQYDWGCKILSFLFEEGDNQVYYPRQIQRNADGSVTYIDPNGSNVESSKNYAVLGAFRKMLGFFSNAVLIIASLKLLYELLQMTAETAQHGRVGGREANQLWAPIRLVVAIGLLVPLSSGLNS